MRITWHTSPAPDLAAWIIDTLVPGGALLHSDPVVRRTVLTYTYPEGADLNVAMIVAFELAVGIGVPMGCEPAAVELLSQAEREYLDQPPE